MNGFKATYEVRLPPVCILWKFSSLFSELSTVPQALGPLLFNNFINVISARMNNTKFILFADDLKVYQDVVCWILRNSTRRHWFGTLMVCWKPCGAFRILRSYVCRKDIGIMLNSKLYFHCHPDYDFSQRTDEIRSKLLCASVIWNNLTSMDSNEIENTYDENLPVYIIFYVAILGHLFFQILYFRKRLDILFFIVFKDQINWHFIMDTVNIPVYTRHIKEFYTFKMSCALRRSPSDKCVIDASDMNFW